MAQDFCFFCQATFTSIAALFQPCMDNSEEEEDPFEEYVSTRTLAVEDPLAYWHNLLSSPTMGPLARMALDILSAPGKLI